MRKRLRVVVEGWRFLNHSYAVSNRHYLQWLLNDPRLEVYHREMPYFRPEWQAVPSYVFPSHVSPALELGTPPSGFEPDWTLRFDFPHRLSPPQHGRLLVFMTSEYTRLNLENIAPGLSLEQAAREVAGALDGGNVVFGLEEIDEDVYGEGVEDESDGEEYDENCMMEW